MSGPGVVDLPISGRVDAALIRGLIDLGEALKGAARGSEEAAESASKARDGFARVEQAVRNAPETIGQLAQSYTFLTSALADVQSRIEGVAQLATAQERLSAQSRALGLDMDRAAAAAGIFSDEVDALGAASRFATMEIRLSQTELDALERVAGSTAETMGISTTDAVNTLTESLIRGREAGLQRFGGELAAVAGGSHTVGERLAALVERARHVTTATDNSSAAMARLRDRFDDYKRTAASAFMDELVRLTSMGNAASTTAEDLATLTTTLQGVGSAIATMTAMVIGGIRYLVVELISEVSRLGNALHLVSNETNTMWLNMSRDALSNLEAMQADREGETGTTLRGIGRRDAANVSGAGPIDFTYERGNALRTSVSTRGETTTDPVRRLRSGVSYQPRSEAEAESLRRAEADAMARDDRNSVPHPANDNAHSGSARSNARADAERAAQERYDRAFNEFGRNAMGGADRRAALDLATGAANEGGDPLAKSAAERAAREAAFASSDAGRALTQRRDDDAAREQRTQASRLASLRSFTSEWEQLHTRQATVAHEAATAGTAALGLFGSTLAKHVELLAQGKESAGDAARAFTSELLTNLGHEAIGKGAVALADAIAAAATPFTAPMAPGLFAASAAYFAAGATLSGLGAAIAPSAPAPAAASGASGDAGTSRRQVSDRRDTSSDSAAPIIVNYYAPVIGGRESTDAEVGVRLGRFDDAARARRTRRAA